MEEAVRLKLENYAEFIDARPSYIMGHRDVTNFGTTNCTGFSLSQRRRSPLRGG